MFSRALASSLVASSLSLSLAACAADDPAGTARFSTMSAEEREQTIGFAISQAFAMPYFALFGVTFAQQDDDPCPGKVVAGATTTFTGGCTSLQGVTYAGELAATNVPLLANDPPIVDAAPSIIELRGWSDGELALDGRYEQSMANPVDGDAYTTDVAYVMTQAGHALEVEASTDCVRGGPCTFDGAYDLGPLGSFTMAGDAAFEPAPSGWIELRGAETLRLDLDATDDAGCAPFTIDGRPSGALCFDAPEPEPEPALSVSGGLTCSMVELESSYVLDATVTGAAVTVDGLLVFAADDVGLAFDLAQVSSDPQAGTQAWSGSAAATASCDVTFRVRATDADGNTACLASGPNAQRFAAEGCTVF